MPVVHTARHASLEYAIALEATSTDQDRALVVPVPNGLVFALADGAGGTAHGARAADAVIAAVRANPTADPAGLLVDLDDPDRLGMAQCTAVIAHVDRCSERPTIRGASVGDSEAWLLDLLDPTILVPLTSAQHRKPLLGAGCAPVAYSHALSPTSLVVLGSDGLFRYALPRELARAARATSLDAAARALVDLVRLPTGGLQDDVSLILCRETAQVP